MFIKTGYFTILIFLVLLSSCSSYEVEGIKENISGGSSSVSKDAASFSQDLELSSTTELQKWLGTSFNAARDAKLHLNLQYSGNRSPEGSATYKGSFSISYIKELHNGEVQSHEYVMTTGDTQSETQYNYVYLDEGGNFTWKAFFQDEFGSLLIILTQGQKADECSENDGCDNEVFFSMANGAVYYRNWPDRGQSSLSPTRCWLVTSGPYDCRTWKSGSRIDIDKAVEPDGSAATLYKGNGSVRPYCYTNGQKESPCNNIAYTKLATFKDLDFKILFEIDPNLTSAKLKPSSSLLAINKKGKVLTGVASTRKTNTSRSLSSVKNNKIRTILPVVLLISLSLIFMSLLLVVFFRKKEDME